LPPHSLKGSDRPLRVFITGASSGLGAALTQYYGAAGAQLGLVGRRADGLQAAAAGLDAYALYQVDVRDAAGMQQAAMAYLSDVGAPDIVIAAAGISVGTLTEFAEDAPVFRAVMEANVLGLVHTFQPFIGAMPPGSVLCGISSVAGIRGLPGGRAYSASKAAATVYLEALRLELKARDIAVVTVAPGYIDTPMTRVNPYAMPFRMSAETAAAKTARCIARRRRYSVIPWQMAWGARMLKWLPIPVYDAVFEKAPRKPRNLPT